MRRFLLLALLNLIPFALRAQVTLEHVYPINHDYGFGLVEVDSGDWRYATYNRRDSIALYFMDHSLDRIIVLPQPHSGDLINISKRLFDLDTAYEYLVTDNDSGGCAIYKENGTLLLSLDHCQLGSNPHTSTNAVGLNLSPFIQTPQGAKLLIFHISNGKEQREVYSLPGKLFGSVTLAVDKIAPDFDAGGSAFAYPNPSSGSPVHIEYQLPVGVVSGRLLITSETGQILRQYIVSDAFTDIVLNSSELPSGTYFYKLITTKGEGTTKRLVWLR